MTARSQLTTCVSIFDAPSDVAPIRGAVQLDHQLTQNVTRKPQSRLFPREASQELIDAHRTTTNEIGAHFVRAVTNDPILPC